MTHQVIDDAGQIMDARVEIDTTSVTLQSRGGSASNNPVNSDYGAALRLLLKRLIASQILFEGAWVDSIDAQALPIAERIVLSREELVGDGSAAFTLLSRRAKAVGQKKGQKGGNSTKRIRLQFSSPLNLSDVEEALRIVSIDTDDGSAERLPATELSKVTDDYLWNAIEALHDPAFKHRFGQSIDFDLVTDLGRRFPPKAVFGVAASMALGFEVQPKHFTGGTGSQCFRILQRAGFAIVLKGEQISADTFPTSPEDREWTEGKLRLVTHLRRERASGLAHAKKKQFIEAFGRLYCEQCGMDPVKHYGSPHGASCIEVHHSAVHLEDMAEGHRTKLEHMRCLCANCHRYVHRLIKTELEGKSIDTDLGVISS